LCHQLSMRRRILIQQYTYSIAKVYKHFGVQAAGIHELVVIYCTWRDSAIST
jgi:hypothetical protein